MTLLLALATTARAAHHERRPTPPATVHRAAGRAPPQHRRANVQHARVALGQEMLLVGVRHAHTRERVQRGPARPQRAELKGQSQFVTRGEPTIAPLAAPPRPRGHAQETHQINVPELDGIAIAATVFSTSPATAPGESATPPCAPSALSTSPSSTAASAGAAPLTWAPAAQV